MMARILPLLFVLLVSTAAHAGGAGEARLREFFAATRSLQADFDQVLLDEHGRLRQQSHGRFWLQRPGRFRWDYAKPYPQQIIADGERIWFYDPGLEQVTVKSLKAGLGATPAALLSDDDAAALDRDFRIHELGRRDGALWVRLEPKGDQNEFREMRLAFKGRELAVMEVVDGFGQTTRITFRNETRNPPIPAGTFRFVAPKGVDVIGDTGTNPPH